MTQCISPYRLVHQCNLPVYHRAGSNTVMHALLCILGKVAVLNSTAASKNVVSLGGLYPLQWQQGRGIGCDGDPCVHERRPQYGMSRGSQRTPASGLGFLLPSLHSYVPLVFICVMTARCIHHEAPCLQQVNCFYYGI